MPPVVLLDSWCQIPRCLCWFAVSLSAVCETEVSPWCSISEGAMLLTPVIDAHKVLCGFLTESEFAEQIKRTEQMVTRAEVNVRAEPE